MITSAVAGACAKLALRERTVDVDAARAAIALRKLGHTADACVICGRYTNWAVCCDRCHADPHVDAVLDYAASQGLCRPGAYLFSWLLTAGCIVHDLLPPAQGGP